MLYSGVYANKHWLHWPLPSVVTSHLGDLLSLHLMLSLALAAHRLLIDRTGTLPVGWLAGAWLLVAGWFEGLLPLWSAQAVADPLDIVAYSLGTLGFHYWLNRSPLASPLRGKPAERAQGQFPLAGIVQVYLTQLAHGFFAGKNGLRKVIQNQGRKT